MKSQNMKRGSEEESETVTVQTFSDLHQTQTEHL